ncbi:MAG TPA: hypothetical protein VM282_16515 [Acidimicrobiales bacterium]|nr:hypothetical protein [Acidimicrobiales bacterium]
MAVRHSDWAEHRPDSRSVSVGATALRDPVRCYVDSGVTKFVVRPNVAAESWETELHHLADTLFDLQT